MASEDMNEVVTRGILKHELKEELKKAFEIEFPRFKAELKAELKAERKAEFDAFRLEVREDMNHIAKVILERMEELLGLREEPVKDLPARVTVLEQADLPARVSRLEAKVFPPKRPARRRG